MPLLFPTSFAAPKEVVTDSQQRPKKRARVDKEASVPATVEAVDHAKSKKPKQSKRKDKKSKDDRVKLSQDALPVVKPQKQPPPAPKAKKGDDLQSQLKSKLAGGRFRMLNSALYTTSGEQGKELMSDKEAFDAYHEGFRAQAAHWPASPVNIIAGALKTMPKRSLIVDIGCGDAGLAQKLVPLGIKVLSFDLLKENDWVAEAEGGKLPLPGPQGAVVDAAVCCLSLMPTDWIRFIEEAQRVLVPEGTLKIAEVASRFSDLDDFVATIEKTGFTLVDKDTTNSHFYLFTFKKRKGKSSALSAEEKERASALLKPCNYKKR